MRRISVLLASLLIHSACTDKCVPHSETCVRDTYAICSSTGHGYVAGGRPEVPCSAVGGHCVVENGRAHCALLDASDASADASDVVAETP